MTEDGCYRTDDLALATLLAVSGYKYELKKLTSSKAIWIFVYPSEKEDEFDDLLSDYAEFAAKVEPREFVLRWGEMRRELFAIIPAPPKRRPVAPTPATQS